MEIVENVVFPRLLLENRNPLDNVDDLLGGSGYDLLEESGLAGAGKKEVAGGKVVVYERLF